MKKCIQFCGGIKFKAEETEAAFLPFLCAGKMAANLYFSNRTQLKRDSGANWKILTGFLCSLLLFRLLNNIGDKYLNEIKIQVVN